MSSKLWMERVVLLDDKALGSMTPSEDVLDLTSLVQIAANSLRDSDGPMVIHVDGGWGRGKTSFCRILDKELQPPENSNGSSESPPPPASDYDQSDSPADTTRSRPVDVAWYVASDQDGPPEDAVLYGIATAISKGDRDEALSIVRTWGSTEIDLGSGVARREAFRAWARRALGWVEDPFEEGEPTVSLGEARFEALRDDKKSSTKAKRKDSDRKLEMEYTIAVPERRTAVLIIDDLDRCTPDWTLRVLDAVRLYVACEGIAFVIAADRDVIDGAFSRTVEGLGVDGVRHSGEAMEKYIRHRIQIPSLAETPPENVSGSMQMLQNQLFEDPGFEILCGPTADFADGIGTTLALTFSSTLTPRRLKRILNDLATRLARAADRMRLDAVDFRNADMESKHSRGQSELGEVGRLGNYFRLYFANCVWVTLSYQWPELVENIPEPRAIEKHEKLLGDDRLLALGLLGQQRNWPDSIVESLIDHTAGGEGNSSRDLRAKWEACRFLAKCGQAWDSYFGKPDDEDDEFARSAEFMESDAVIADSKPLDPHEVLRRWEDAPQGESNISKFLEDHRRALLNPTVPEAFPRKIRSRIRWAIERVGEGDYPVIVQIISLLEKHGAPDVAEQLFEEAEDRGVFGKKSSQSMRLTGEFVQFLLRERDRNPAQAGKYLKIYEAELETPSDDLNFFPLAIGAVLYDRRSERRIPDDRADRLVDYYFDRARKSKTAKAARQAIRILCADESFDAQKWSEISRTKSGNAHRDPVVRWLAADGLRHSKDEEDIATAIELYEGLEGSRLWMPSVVHNLALLQSKYGERDRALDLWESLYRNGHRDTRMQREFSHMLDRVDRIKDARCVQNGEPLRGSFDGDVKEVHAESEVKL